VSVRFYMDHHVRGEITAGLRLRGIDVLAAEKDGNARSADPVLLTRASALGRILFSNDHHLPAEAARRQRAGEFFAGLIDTHQLSITIGRAIEDLELIAKVYEPADMENRVEYILL
jgi:hypothetical protein